jgi:hypothetical protein
VQASQERSDAIGHLGATGTETSNIGPWNLEESNVAP